MDISLSQPSPRALEIMAWLRDYAERRLDLSLADERRCLPPHVFLDFGRVGLLGVQGEEKWGGLNLCPSDCLHISQQLGAIDLTLSISILLQSFLVTEPIRRHACASVKQKFLPDLVSGRTLGSFCLTEREAGSDPRRIRTTAHQQPDGSWRLNGEKIWSGNAAWAGVLLVFGKAFDIDGKELGITGFIVERDTPGVEQGNEARTMGLRSMVQNSMIFRNAEVATDGVLGSIGQGLSVASETMTFARLMIAAICLGTMRRCLQIAVTYVQQRRIGTGSMAINPNVLAILEECRMEAIALETLVNYAGRVLDNGETLPEEFYCAMKVLAPEMLGRIADKCLQLLGGRGYIETNCLARIYRDARILRIFEGPTETIAAYLGARLWHNATPFYILLKTFEAGDLASQIEAKIQELQKIVASSTIDTQRSLTLRAHFLLGHLSANALTIAALQLHESVNPEVTRLSNTRWKADLQEITTQITNVLPTNTLDLLETFIGTIGSIKPFSRGEDWETDSFLA